MASGIGIIHFWNDTEIGIIGGPPSALLVWENEYRELTGVEMVNDLDGSGVIVCVVDSGIDLSHPDLQGLELSGWFDAVNDQSDPTMMRSWDSNGRNNGSNGSLKGISGSRITSSKGHWGRWSRYDEYVPESVDWCV